jgi:hypothetical protein
LELQRQTLVELVACNSDIGITLMYHETWVKGSLV